MKKHFSLSLFFNFLQKTVEIINFYISFLVLVFIWFGCRRNRVLSTCVGQRYIEGRFFVLFKARVLGICNLNLPNFSGDLDEWVFKYPLVEECNETPLGLKNGKF
jgi:hypothetical protein